MTLSHSGDQVSGSHGSSGNPGQYTLTMAPDGRSFSGTWSRTGASGTWTGTRQQPAGKAETGRGPASAASSGSAIRALAGTGRRGLTAYGNPRAH